MQKETHMWVSFFVRKIRKIRESRDTLGMRGKSTSLRSEQRIRY